MRSRSPNRGLSVVLTIFLAFIMCIRVVPAQATDAIDSILLSNEFKAEERQVLSSLPITSVDVLTDRLNTAPINDIKTHRLFDFLVFKAKQFSAELPEDKKSAVLKALRAKTGSDEEHRQSLIRSVEAAFVGGRPNQTDGLQSVPVVPPAPKQAPEAKPTASTPNEAPASPTPWSIVVVMIVAAGGLLWLLLKRRS